MLDFFI